MAGMMADGLQLTMPKLPNAPVGAGYLTQLPPTAPVNQDGGSYGGSPPNITFGTPQPTYSQPTYSAPQVSAPAASTTSYGVGGMTGTPAAAQSATSYGVAGGMTGSTPAAQQPKQTPVSYGMTDATPAGSATKQYTPVGMVTTSGKSKTPTAWKPDDLAGALDYKRPDYNNLFSDGGGFHSSDETRAAMSARAKAADEANTALYSDWQSKYSAARTQKDAADAAKEQDFNNSVSDWRSGQPNNWQMLDGQPVQTVSSDGPQGFAYAPADASQTFTGQDGRSYGWDSPDPTYQKDAYTPWTMDAPTNYSKIIETQQAQQDSAKNASFGGLLNGGPSQSSFGGLINGSSASGASPNSAAPWAPPGQPRLDKLSSSRVSGGMPAQPQYIGAGMGTPNTAQGMGRGLSAAAVKPPGR